jgi:hypothetical protein
MRKLSSLLLGLLALSLTLSGVAVAQNVGTHGTTFTIDSGATDTSTNALIFGGNSNKIINITDGTFVLDRNASGTVSLSATDDNSDAALTVGPGGAAALQLGTASATSVSIVTDGGTVTIDGTIPAAGVADVVRSIPLPLGSWVPCAGAVAGVWDAAGADAAPDLAASPAGHLMIEYDDTVAEIDVDTICTTFTVPADWASGGALRARVTQGGATAEIETFSCTASLDGAAASAANAGNLVSQTAVQTVTSTPAITWAAGKSIQVACAQGNASADDTVNIHSIEAFYTATQ